MSQTRMLNKAPSSDDQISKFSASWKRLRFFLEKRSFESNLEQILRAGFDHESNGLPRGNYQYELLNAEADSVCEEFAARWGLDLDLLKAQMPGLAKLEALAVSRPRRSYSQLLILLLTVPFMSFLVGIVGGLVNVGFHLVGGR